MFMTFMTHDQIETLVEVRGLDAKYPKVLSDFEVETIWSMCDRCLRLDQAAMTTPQEWAVVEGAREAFARHQAKKSRYFFNYDQQGPNEPACIEVKS